MTTPVSLSVKNWWRRVAYLCGNYRKNILCGIVLRIQENSLIFFVLFSLFMVIEVARSSFRFIFVDYF